MDKVNLLQKLILLGDKSREQMKMDGFILDSMSPYIAHFHRWSTFTMSAHYIWCLLTGTNRCTVIHKDSGK